jgi:hypothetical protein
MSSADQENKLEKRAESLTDSSDSDEDQEQTQKETPTINTVGRAYAIYGTTVIQPMILD